MSQFLTPLISSLPKFTLMAMVDILVVAILIYQLISIIRGRRSAHILIGIGILLLIYVASLWAGFELLRSILAYLAPFTPVALIVMFQSELRRLLARLGRRRWLTLGSRLQRREFHEEILMALEQLASTRTGALIVVERDIGLRTFIESGVAMDAIISRDLLLAIFQHNAALHDGAVIVQADRVAAASCFLPLSMNPMILRKLGTRHRAAIGITEESDCLSLVVSEETGNISIAAFGEMEIEVTLPRVEQRLANHFNRRRQDYPPASGKISELPIRAEEREWRRVRGS